VAPTVIATSPSKSPWIRINGTLSWLQKLLLGGNIINVGGNNDLRYKVSDALSGDIEIGVVIYDVTGNPVRLLDGGTINVTPGTTHNGSVSWDGYQQSLTNLVPVGVYYYRVAATDEAGNTSFSGESKITITLL